jgi:hypothetical protein
MLPWPLFQEGPHLARLRTPCRQEKRSRVENEKKDECPCLGAQHESKARSTDAVRLSPAVSSAAVSSALVSTASSCAAQLSSFSPPPPLYRSPSHNTAAKAAVALTRHRRTARVRVCRLLTCRRLVCRRRSPPIGHRPIRDPHMVDRLPIAALRQRLRRARTPHPIAFPRLRSHRERRRA